MPYFQTSTGCKIYYERYGTDGPAIILLHGLASSSRIWTHLIRTLQTSYQVFALDFPGHGQSDRWDDYSFDSLVALLSQWMDACGISKATLIGVSLGCTVALSFALQYPERTTSLLLEGPLGGYLPWWKPLGCIDRLVFAALPILLQASVILFGSQATAYWLNTFGVKRKRNLKSIEDLLRQVDFKAVRQLLWQSSCPPYINQLEQIKTPVLLICGSNDPMPKRFILYIKTHLPNATLTEIPQTRHLSLMEKPHEFSRIVLRFLAHV